MVFHPSKLLNDSLDDYLAKFCESYCDPVENRERFCPIPCIARCYPTCIHPLFYDIPPPEYLSGSNDDHSRRSFRISIFLVITLAILATTFFIICCYAFYKFYWYRSRRRPPPPPQPQEEEFYPDFIDEDRGSEVDHPIWYIRTVGLHSSVIRAITICKYKRGDGLVEGTECSVCLNEFQEDETLRLLPKCKHAFHIPCIDTWLQSHTNCPMCRAGIVINSPNLQSPEPSNRNSGLVEESQVEVSEYPSESRMEREVSIQVEDEGELQVQNALKRNEDVGKDEGNNDGKEWCGIQPLRRSVSIDSLSASVVSAAMANALLVNNSERNLDNQCQQMNDSSMVLSSKRVDVDDNLVGSSSTVRSMPKGRSVVKRSLSCGAKLFLSRYGRSRSSLLPS